MNKNTDRRKRRRRPTITPRFASNSLAFEIGLIRLADHSQILRDLEEKEKKTEKK